MSDGTPVLLQFIGRLHVMLVHLPIGFLILLAGLEVLGLHSKLKHATTSNRIIAGLTVLAITTSAAFGWVLAWCNSGYDTNLLFWHRWTGTALVPLGVLIWWLNWRNQLLSYRICLAATVMLLVIAGHFGASLTHGSNYLTPWFSNRPAVEASGSYAELMEQPVYAAVVQPILNGTCVSCHGAEKSKGGLRVDTLEHLLKGGENGSVIVAGDAEHSDLIRRILLPLDSDDHMPPDGKRQPTFNDIELLKWWIAMGAPTDKRVSELRPPQNIVSILQSKGGGGR